MSILKVLSYLIGLIKALVPRIKKILKILLPIMLPTARSALFFLAAVMEAANSGKDVPAETIVKPIILLSTPNN